MILRLTAFSSALLLAGLPAQGGTGATTKPQGKTPPASEKGGEQGGDRARAAKENPGGDDQVVPDAIGLMRRGLIDAHGRPVNREAAEQLRALKIGGTGAGATPPPAPRSDLPVPGGHVFVPNAFLRPRRLAAGQQGTLHVLVQFRGDVVVREGSVAKLELASDQGPLQLGAPALAPPRAMQHGVFEGTRIYQGTMDFTVPVTIAAGAARANVPVAGTVTLEIHDGTTGKRVGLFASPVQGKISVGPPLSVAGPGDAHRVAGSTAGAPTAKGADKPAGAPDATAPKSAGPADVVPSAPPAARERAASRTAAPSLGDVPQATPTPLNWGWVLGGGGAVLSLLLLLVLRRR
ncbi:MAG: hypothetical protein KDC87_01560 [Planctomycetes bacterium]|nr:hypothetical protein [Planctomycetota bacterium]MCB9869057.1 hypothetical protein [Planctomycetota bacterium]MCB9888016.1 hypothetical protein [Planctomycetota bacterium]